MEKLESGMIIEFLYPASNHRGVRPRLERRRLRIDRVRELQREPIDPITEEWHPLVIRGQRLVTGWDLDKQAERSFYEESMRDVRECELPSDEELTYSVFATELEDLETIMEDLPREEADGLAFGFNGASKNSGRTVRALVMAKCDH
jgi:hypothetical protein